MKASKQIQDQVSLLIKDEQNVVINVLLPEFKERKNQKGWLQWDGFSILIFTLKDLMICIFTMPLNAASSSVKAAAAAVGPNTL